MLPDCDSYLPALEDCRTGARDSDPSSGKRWYAVQVQPRAENRAVRHLAYQSYVVFFPCFEKTIRHARKTTIVKAPVFPGYIFVQLDIGRQGWRRINNTVGVVRLLATHDVPQPVPEGIVEALLCGLEADGSLDIAETLAVGQQVRITQGPFADLVGTLQHLDGASRVRVLLELLGRHVLVSVPGEALVVE